KRLPAGVYGKRLLQGRERYRDFMGQDGTHFGIADLAVIAVLGNQSRQAMGFAHAHVGPDQSLFQSRNDLRRQPLLGEEAGDAAGKTGIGFGQAFLQAREQARLFRWGFAECPHAALPSNLGPSVPVTSTGTMLPTGAAPSKATGAKHSLWPKPAFSTSTKRLLPVMAAKRA